VICACGGKSKRAGVGGGDWNESLK